MPGGRVLLEVCIESPDDALAAEDGGAGRLELNAALALGGLTPSAGAIEQVKAAVSLPVIVMIRPRAGGFAYSKAEFRLMLRDAELALGQGADGIAFGILRPDGGVDVDRCRELARLAAGRETVFHRAFDVTPDPSEALERLVDLGIRRVMTSGQEESAYNGIATIAALIRKAAGRIELLPAGGINRFTLADVVSRTGCDQVHASLRSGRPDPSTSARPKVGFGRSFRPPEDRFDATDPAAVADLVARLGGDGPA